MSRPISLVIGKQAEKAAELFLIRRGLSLLFRNFWCSTGELDLIMQDQDNLVFIEVKYRKNNVWLDPVEVVESKKRKKIIDTSLYFLQRHKQYLQQGCRFDVVLVTGEPIGRQIKWIKDAFQA